MKMLKMRGFAVLAAVIIFNFAAFASLSNTSQSLPLKSTNSVDGYYVYLYAHVYAHADNYFYISKIVFIRGKSVYDNVYIERRETLKKQFINKVKAHSDKQILMTDVYVIKQDDHENREELESKRLGEISRQKERGNDIFYLTL